MKPDQCLVRAFLVAEGLTQFSLRLANSPGGKVKRTPLPVQDTARALKLGQQADKEVRKVYEVLGEYPELMEYAMDAQGCSLAIGYSSLS